MMKNAGDPDEELGEGHHPDTNDFANHQLERFYLTTPPLRRCGSFFFGNAIITCDP